MTEPPRPVLSLQEHAIRNRYALSIAVGCSGLMGGAGVLVAAAGAHTGGGEVARTAADFLMIHAAVVLAGSALAWTLPRTPLLLGSALTLLILGPVVFSGDLAASSLLQWRPLPLAAPVGGMMVIAGWLALAGSALQLRRA